MFYFNGKSVCSSFLKIAFRFSLDLECSLGQTCKVCGSEKNPNQIVYKRPSIGKDWIIVFQERLAESTRDPVPYEYEIHLRFYPKKIFTMRSSQSIQKASKALIQEIIVCTQYEKRDASNRRVESVQIFEVVY